MRRYFTRNDLAQGAPSFLLAIDKKENFKITPGSRAEKSMIEFLKKNGFPMRRVYKYGFGFETDDFGGVAIEVL